MVLSSNSPIATIPNVVATHLVGERTLQIARGQLTLQPTSYGLQRDKAHASSSGGKDAKHDKHGAQSGGALPSHHGEADAADPNLPVLLLSVGNATWPLYPSTLFGTHDRDEMLYTFLAEMSPPKDSDDVVDDQPVSPKQTHAILEPEPEPEPEPASTTAGGGEALPATWIRLTLPAAVCAYKSPVQLGRDRMETLLIQHGLLKDGLAAATDEIAMSAKQAGQQQAAQTVERTNTYLAANPPTKLPASFSGKTHRRVSSAAQATATGASYTQSASEAISDLVASTGAAVGKAFAWTRRGSAENRSSDEAPSQLERRPSNSNRRISLERFGLGRSKSPNAARPGPASRSPSEQRSLHPETAQQPANPNAPPTTLQSFGEAASGVAEGLTTTGSAAIASAQRIVANDHGEEAAKLTGETGQMAANTGQMGVDLTLNTSAVYHGTVAGKGAYDQSQSTQR